MWKKRVMMKYFTGALFPFKIFIFYTIIIMLWMMAVCCYVIKGSLIDYGYC